MTTGSGRKLTQARRKTQTHMEEFIFVVTGSRLIRSDRRFAEIRFLRVALIIFPVSTPNFVENPLLGRNYVQSVRNAQFVPADCANLRQSLAR